jgi:hypothetical protein
MGWLHAVVDVPEADHTRSAEFWSAALGWPLGEAWDGHPELRSFEPLEGRPYVHLQEIDGEPRVHVDLETSAPEQVLGHALHLGAEILGRHDGWRTLCSPGGLPFCVVDRERPEPPAPATWPDGHRSRLVQVCIDSPVAAHDREVAFWRSVLAARWVPSDADEFAGKWHDDAGSPLQLLFQRLDEPTGPVRAHLDHGTDDVPAEVRRLLDLGAQDVGPGHGGWHVLRDPAGLPFCVTGNSPEQTPHRDLR